MADQLEACNIIAGGASVPAELGEHGLRIGVQEVTRRGMTTADVPEVADCIVGALRGDDLEGVKRRAAALGRRFNGMRFTLEEV